MTSNIIGSFEPVSFPLLATPTVIAKVDTGAYSGTLHATNIEEISADDGSKKVRFFPLGNSAAVAETNDYKCKQVRSSNGQLETRFIISTKIILQGQEYPITISLADRSAMMKSVLIGRQFLRQHHFMVDVRQGTQYSYAVKETEL